MRTTYGHVYFWNGVFSNWHPCKFTDSIDGIFEYSNTEQAFMYYKAKFFGDRKTGIKILGETDPKKCKQLGRQIEDFDEKAWECVRVGFMTYVNLLKYSQNEDLKRELLETGDRVLVEASPYDKVWGVGLAEDDYRIDNKKNWQGLNLLGESLEIVRRLLK